MVLAKELVLILAISLLNSFIISHRHLLPRRSLQPCTWSGLFYSCPHIVCSPREKVKSVFLLLRAVQWLPVPAAGPWPAWLTSLPALSPPPISFHQRPCYSLCLERLCHLELPGSTSVHSGLCPDVTSSGDLFKEVTSDDHPPSLPCPLTGLYCLCAVSLLH